VQGRRVIIAVTLVWMAGCSVDPPRKVTLAEEVPRGGQVVELDGVTVDRFRKDRLASRARLEQATLDREKNTLEGTGIRVVAETATITAPRGHGELGDKAVVLEGGVVMINEGHTVRSDRMIYDAAKETITAPGEVTVEGENFRARGRSLVMKRNEQLLEIEGPTTATITAVERGAK
jgi:lipopolysaccharide export system protein LptA